MALVIRCPKHKRYNPYKHGEGAIVGGCKQCLALWRAYLIALEMFLEMR